MMRRFWFIAAVFLAGCGSDSGSRWFEFPEALRGGWELVETADIAAGATPTGIVQLGLVRARRAIYEGQDKLSVVVYEMSSWGGALELAQTWQPVPGMFAFQTSVEVGPYFVILDSPGLDYDTFLSLADELDAASAEQSR